MGSPGGVEDRVHAGHLGGHEDLQEVESYSQWVRTRAYRETHLERAPWGGRVGEDDWSAGRVFGA